MSTNSAIQNVIHNAIHMPIQDCESPLNHLFTLTTKLFSCNSWVIQLIHSVLVYYGYAI